MTDCRYVRRHYLRKMYVNEQVYLYNGRGFLWIQNENLNFSTTKMATVLILTRNG